MKRLLRSSLFAAVVFGALLYGALSMVASCAHITTPVKDCSAETAVGLIDDVNRVLATGDWQSGVAGLIADFGECVIRKVLERIAGDDTRAQHDDLAALQQRRARAWLDAHPGP